MVLLIFLQPPIGILEKRRAAQPPIGILYIYNGFMIFMIFVDFSSTPHQPFAKMAPHNPPLGYPIITMVLVLLSLPQPPIGTSTGCSQDAPMTSPERPQDAPRTLPGRSQARPKGAPREIPRMPPETPRTASGWGMVQIQRFYHFCGLELFCV